MRKVEKNIYKFEELDEPGQLRAVHEIASMLKDDIKLAKKFAEMWNLEFEEDGVLYTENSEE